MTADGPFHYGFGPRGAPDITDLVETYFETTLFPVLKHA